MTNFGRVDSGYKLAHGDRVTISQENDPFCTHSPVLTKGKKNQT